MRTAHRLSALKVARTTKPGTYEDGHGLRLLVTEGGSKRWVLRCSINGKRVARGLGTYPSVSLENAREEAAAFRRAARDGKDFRHEQKRLTPQSVTFEQAFYAYFNEAKRPTLKPGRFIERWPTSMKLHVFPVIGSKPVAEVTPSDVIAVLKPLWYTRPETGRRILQRLQAVFDSAILRGFREKASPCTGVRRELGTTRPRVEHRKALPWKDVPGFVARLRGQPRISQAARLALEFLILTCGRSNEVRGARWSEINLETREWVVPAERMKMKVAHVVPLSEPVLAVLRQAEPLRRPGIDFVFPSSVGSPLSDNTLSKVLREWKVAGTPHGFRTSFKVWAAEVGIRDEVSEAVLAHSDSNKVRAAYRRTTYLDERRTVMQRWAEYATNIKC